MKFKGAGIELDFNKTTFGVERASVKGDTTEFCFVKGKNFGLPSGNCFLIKSSFENEKFKAEFLYFNNVTAIVTVEEKYGAILFSYVFSNEGKKAVSLEEGEIGFYASFNDGGADAEIALKRRLQSHVRVGKSFAHIYPVRNAGSGPVIALLMTKGGIPSYALERGIKENDRGEILLNFPAMTLEPKQTYEAEFALFVVDNRWDFEDKKVSLGAPDLRAYGLCGFAGEALTVRAPEALTLQTEDGVFPFVDGECSIEMTGFGKKTAVVRSSIGSFELTYFVLSPDLVQNRAQYLFKNHFVKEGPFKGAFCAFDESRNQMILKKSPKSGFSFAGDRATPLLFLLACLNSGETFSEELISAVETSIHFYDREVFAKAKTAGAKRKKSKYFKNYEDYPLYAAIKYEEYLYKKDVSSLIESAAILIDFYQSDCAYLCTNAAAVHDALKKEGKTAVADALKDRVVSLADKVLASGNRYSCFKKAKYAPELVAGVLSLLTDACQIGENDYYLIPAEDHLIRLKAFLAPSLSYEEDYAPIIYRENRSTGKISEYSTHCSACVLALVFARYALVAKKDKFFFIAKKILKSCLSLYGESGKAIRGKIAPRTINDVRLPKCEEISFGEDLILYHFNLLFMRRSLII